MHAEESGNLIQPWGRRLVAWLHRLLLGGLWGLGWGPAAVCAGPVGGGALMGGFQGEYFAGPEFQGTPAFTRRDVRIDFDWGTSRRPGGSGSPGFAALGVDDYAIRWTARLASRFSETYRFRVITEDEVRCFLKPTEASDWMSVVLGSEGPDAWVGEVPMREGAAYDFRLEYIERTGPARVSLRWSSPSTPEEVIDVASQAAINLDTYGEELWANAMDGARDEWRDLGFGEDQARWPARDANGWPRGDGAIIVWEGAEPGAVRGRYRLSFVGRARVSAQGTAAEFFVNGVSQGNVLPAGTGWDSGSNRTTVEVEIVPVDILFLSFADTRRLPGDATNTGVAEVRLMKPVAVGGSSSLALGERFDPRARQALGRYQALRWISNFETERTWADRVLPGYSTHRDITTRRHWELMVQLSNETGKDLYACIPYGADDAYVRNVARLARYGSDGQQAYEGPVADPVFPPLNPNLRLYLERGNELWNWSFAQAPANAAQGQAEVRDRTANGRILNFDGANPGGDQFYRWHALRSLQMSEIVRSVWGDAAMGTRVRFLLEYQYDNDQNTAASAYDFVDRYFNNADGQLHVESPHPVNHFFWGGGAAVYYSSGNAQGIEAGTSVENGGFELPVLREGPPSVSPEGSGWSFSGNAGFYRRAEVRELWSVSSPGAITNAPPARRWLGCRFTAQESAVAVYELGRAVVGETLGRHELRLVRVSDRQTLAQAEIGPGSRIEGGYARVRLRLPVLLQPGVAYDVLSSEGPGGDPIRNAETRLTAVAGVTVEGAVTAVPGSPDWDSATWQFQTEPVAGSTYGPLLVGVARTPLESLGFPPDPPEGSQALWIAGTGSVSRVVMFPRTGVYALRFQAAARAGLETGVRFFVDQVDVTPSGSSHRGASALHWVPGTGFARDSRQFENNGSFVFEITNAGPRTLRIAATGFPRYYNPFDVRPDPQRQVFFDALEVGSVDAIFAGGVPGNGEANGQTSASQPSFESRIRSQARYAQAYGLAVVAYEGGWSMGGDFGAVPIQNWAKFRDARAAQSAIDSMDQFSRSGGEIYTWGTYTTWPRGEIERSGEFPLAQGVEEHGSRLPPEPTHGHRIPGNLNARDATWSLGLSLPSGVLSPVGAWVGWNVIAPTTAEYRIRPSTAGTGSVRMWVDGRQVGESMSAGAPLTLPVRLTRGLHHVRVQCVAGESIALGLEVSLPGAPEAPTSVAVLDDDGSITVKWDVGTPGPVPTGFVVRYGTESGYPTEVVNVADPGTREWRLPGLRNGVRYFVRVAARNEVGVGQESAELAAIPFGTGDPVPLVVFEFTGNRGTEVTAPPLAASSRVRAGSIRRGQGLKPTTYPEVGRNTYGSTAYLNFYGKDFEASRGVQQYYEITVEPGSGYGLRLDRMRFRPYFQNATGLPTDPRGAGLTYSTNGVDFVAVPIPGVASYFGTTEFVLGLADQAALQAVTGAVVFRIYLFGNGPYEFTGIGGPGDDLVLEGALLARDVVRPRLAIRGEGTQLRLEVSELRAGFGHQVERSGDLSRWEPVAGAEGSGASAFYLVPRRDTDGAEYFRIVVR